MQVGCHVSISGGIDRSVDNAVERGCTAFQIFSRNPRGWRAKEISKDEAGTFKKKLKESKIEPSGTCVHMPYLPNLASTNDESHKKSVDTLIGEVERCGLLGIPFLVTHLGSHLGAGEEKGIERLVKAYKSAAGVKNGVTILLENTAGQKNSVGSEFGQLGSILSQLRPAKRFGVCLDTCHAFAYGYDLSTRAGAKKSFDEFDKKVGLDNLRVLHLNDAKAGCGSKLDRHYHVGLGSIGKEGMRAAARLASKRGIPMVVETPVDETRDDVGNIKAARALAG
ncbi:endonuclease IV [Cenarchaeum symbiosum A]|uniref:Probable endonuclease 4 n=1 Tax=Cenarchaeum symbiosum (strain A) TaxID=414004 RepID=END4_CENSY|nr:RecName: Full=Probable endonuclease 4; AltName: Full=Endodeoxyribonuclease IV; AltName: Full=Endonuclease IV [Cenarchaeum symbiosum A]ABK78534.1 endonuclease IV [Cenarchaeum symbiosum A]